VGVVLIEVGGINEHVPEVEQKPSLKISFMIISADSSALFD
jgi:hypothetical protein